MYEINKCETYMILTYCKVKSALLQHTDERMEKNLIDNVGETRGENWVKTATPEKQWKMSKINCKASRSINSVLN